MCWHKQQVPTNLACMVTLIQPVVLDTGNWTELVPPRRRSCSSCSRAWHMSGRRPRLRRQSAMQHWHSRRCVRIANSLFVTDSYRSPRAEHQDRRLAADHGAADLASQDLRVRIQQLANRASPARGAAGLAAASPAAKASPPPPDGTASGYATPDDDEPQVIGRHVWL